MVEPRWVPDMRVFGIRRPKVVVGSEGSAAAGGQIVGIP